MAGGHKEDTIRPRLDPAGSSLAPSGRSAGRLAHLGVMDGEPRTQHTTDAGDRYLTLGELAARLGVSVQALYDLRSAGRGPVGFRVGRQLRFRSGEVEAWLARLERADAARHPHRDKP